MRSYVGEPAAAGTQGPVAVSAEDLVDDPATASTLVAALEATWRDIQTHHPELPDVVMVLGSGVERGRLVKLGHWWGGQWLADGQSRGEVLLAGEALHLEPARVFEVLLHEAAHGINAARGVKDTSRGGRYHNKLFAATARQVLLRVRAMPPYGLASTELTPAAVERYGSTIDRLGDAMHIARQLRSGLRIGTEGGIEGSSDGKGGDKEGSDGKPKGPGAAACGCGRKMRMAPSTLAAGPVLCGLCGSEFTMGAERQIGVAGRSGRDSVGVEGSTGELQAAERDPTAGAEGMPGEPERIDRELSAIGTMQTAPPERGEPEPAARREGVANSVVDHGFLARRQAAIATEADPESGLDDAVASVLDRQRERIEAVLHAAPDPADPVLRPLTERRDRLERLLRSSLVANVGRTIDGGTEQHRVGLAELVRRTHAEADHDALSHWYEQHGTYDDWPMPAANAAEGARRQRLARALLKADGTLNGPTVRTPGGMELQAGDRIQPVDDFGDLPAGTLGTIERVDADTGTIEIDFATWGRLRTTLTDSLAGGLRHDYTEIRAPELESARPGVEL